MNSIVTRRWKLSSYALFLCLLICLPSCKTKKALTTEKTEQTILSQEEAIARFLNQPQIDFFSGKAKISIRSQYGTEKGNLYLRIKSDSVIWAAVKKLSVEGGRILITKDSASMINRLEKSYLTKPLDKIAESYGLAADYHYLEDLFIGQTPKLDSTTLWEVTEDSLHYSVKTLAQNIFHTFNLDKRTGTIASGAFHDKFVSDGTWIYGDYRLVKEGMVLPFYRRYELTMGNDEYLSLEINYSEIELDQPKDIKFSIPSHYSRMN